MQKQQINDEEHIQARLLECLDPRYMGVGGISTYIQKIAHDDRRTEA